MFKITMNKVLLYIFCFTLISTGFSQKTTVQVLDRNSENPVSFAKISDGVNSPYLTDIDGKADIAINRSHSYSFRFFGYNDTTIIGSSLIDHPVVFLSAEAQILDEVTIKPGINPAHRIIRNVMEHQEQNNPLKNNSFTYDSYSKLYVTGELKEGVQRDTITDTSMISAMEFLDKQYIFLIETKAKRTFNPPSYDKEEITAYNVSGVKQPIFATIVNQFQSFSFYENNFKLGQKEYINPIAPGGIRRYLFILEDTLFHSETLDTTYIISYRPYKGKNFEGLSGYLYINTKDWAIERVIASPAGGDGAGLEVKISQEYEYTNDRKWFPKKISTEIGFPIDLRGYANLIGRSSLYVRDVKFDVVGKKGFNPVAVEVEEGALADSASLKDARGDTYTGKEAATYTVIDSIAKEANFDRLIQILEIASTGRIPIWVLAIPIDKLVTFNDQEGWRVGLGLETNKRLSKVFTVGGYFAYGFRDKEWKWGGDMSFMLYRERLIKLKLHYSDDLHERGGTDIYNDEFNLVNQSLYRNFFIDLWDRERYAGINVSGLIRQNMKLQLFGNYKRFFFVDNYRYMPLFSNNGTTDKFDVAEVGVVFNWNIRERVMMLENRRVSLGTKWPKIMVKAVKGLGGVFESNYDYYRFNLDLSQDFVLRGAGTITLLSKSGLTLGNVPLTLSQIQQGVGTERAISLSVPNTFETMMASEFFSDRYTSLFFRYTFLPIKNKTSWTEPLFVIHSAAGIGSMQNRTDHQGFVFDTPSKGYYESGLIIDNLLKSAFVGIGAGVFYRYGPYELPKSSDNFFYKLSIRISLGM